MQTHPMQKLIETLNEESRKVRADYHLTLGEAIKKAEAMAPLWGDTFITVVVNETAMSPGRPRSYRGYYSDLAFEPVDRGVTLEEFLIYCRGALNHTFDGYKGGDFIMKEDTPLWISEWGETSDIAIVDLILADNTAPALITKITN